MSNLNQRSIYLAQVDVLRKTPMFQTAYLPYAAAALWAYARQSLAVAEHYALRELLFLRDPIDDVIARMDNPFLVGFSCYCWNTEYNKALAQAIKQRWPNCYILFGGHHVPPGGAMLNELPYVDFLIHAEGELGFQALLTELTHESPDFTAVPGLSYRLAQASFTNPDAALASFAGLPSPYLEGLFDPIVTAHPEIQWCTVWETNRGCPYHCAYCDWGQHNAKVRQFSMERLIAEIEWMSANKIEYIYNADANFGILERDEDILDALAQAREHTGYPQVFLCNTTKTLNERLFRIIEKLNKSGLDRLGPDLALQSLSPTVLRNIGRQNIDDELFAKWIRRYRQAGFRNRTDLILGLPGETLQSFCAGIEKLYSLGQHAGIFYFPCSLLPNSAMAVPAYRKKHGIRSTRKIFKQVMEGEAEKIDEFYDAVIETATMPYEDMLTASYFMLLAQGSHSYGLLRLIAMYLHTESIVSYADFYLRLLDFCRQHPNSLPGEAMARIEMNFTDGIHGTEREPLQIPGFSFGRMHEEQYFFGRAVLEIDRFYADATTFLEQFNLEPGLFEQLMRYQRESILLPGATEKVLDFDYDFPAYFNAIYDGSAIPLQKRAIRLRFSFSSDLSSKDKYFEAIVQRGRFSSNAFYKIDYIPLPV